MASWMQIQENTFVRWCNEHLKKRAFHLKDVTKDLRDGLILINLLEILSGKSIGKYNKNPKVPAQKLENISLALEFASNENIKLVSIGASDIMEGKFKVILGFLWSLVVRYQFAKLKGLSSTPKTSAPSTPPSSPPPPAPEKPASPAVRRDSPKARPQPEHKEEQEETTGARAELLKWINSKLGKDLVIKNFSKDWNDGRAICALVDSIHPGLIPDWRAMDSKTPLENATKGIETAYEKFQVPMLVLPNEMVSSSMDEWAMMTYIAYFRELPDTIHEKPHNALKCSAFGPGLVEAVVYKRAHFTIQTPFIPKPETESSAQKIPTAVLAVLKNLTKIPDNLQRMLDSYQKPQEPEIPLGLKVYIDGPKTRPTPELTSNKDGSFEVAYETDESGPHTVTIHVDEEEIPGSPFQVNVLANESLGGEGKIRVFYATTASNHIQRHIYRQLQNLLEAKKIHLRPDFEPWIAIDIMDPDDRDAVFRKAGTKTLPIIYIDDVYVGDYEKIVELNDSGELDKMLKVLEQKNLLNPPAQPQWYLDQLAKEKERIRLLQEKKDQQAQALAQNDAPVKKPLTMAELREKARREILEKKKGGSAPASAPSSNGSAATSTTTTADAVPAQGATAEPGDSTSH